MIPGNDNGSFQMTSSLVCFAIMELGLDLEQQEIVPKIQIKRTRYLMDISIFVRKKKKKLTDGVSRK